MERQAFFFSDHHDFVDCRSLVAVKYSGFAHLFVGGMTVTWDAGVCPLTDGMA